MPFDPAPWLPGGDLQTIVPALWTLPGPHDPAEALRVAVDAGSSVRLDINRPTAGTRPRGTLLLLHGMGGSGESGYMRATARLAVERGWVAARMNLRNCGGTEAWSRTLYNAGQHGDLARVLERLAGEPPAFPRPHVVAGFSLGGNLTLLHAGWAASACGADAVAGVNPPIDLEACLCALERPRNRLYERHYVVRLCAQLRVIRGVRELTGPVPDPGVIRRLRRLDALFTAPDAGYSSAEEYYAHSSAAPRLVGLARPALVLSARNDPFVPAETFAPHHGHPMITFVHPEHGGHCGYWQRGTPRNWAARMLVDWAESVTKKTGRP